jgi:hypothetical protein
MIGTDQPTGDVREIQDEASMLQGLIVAAGFSLIGVAAYGFWQGLKLKPHDKIPPSKGSWWRT